ncbi:MAG: ribbon-helix-helix domain-containing protein [Rickettsiales bacterium]|jgi:predicted DNA-binding ribbon-helix-helix protein|nr:ribbon-helix-helix domain-containing protein [Rickettsiales bacterium]
MKKYSVSIKGHQTSFSLEPEFWEALRAAAGQRKISVAKLVAGIDEGRKTNLSSALRVFLLNESRRP